MHSSAFDRQCSQRNRQFEAPGAGAAGIEIEHAFARLLLGNMAVAGDYYVESGGCGLEIEIGKIVQDVD
jgi:hypothetical protein